VVAGDLTIDGRDTVWRASIAGYVVPVQHQKSEIRLNLPGGRGELRAILTANRTAIAGHWIQPANSIFNNRYASPVELARIDKGLWRGRVAPLQEQVSLYVSIQSSSNGSLTAFIRNPEFNLFRRRVYQVRLQGSTVVLSQGNQKLEGTYYGESDTLTLPLLDAMPALQLTRRKDFDGIGFYPRVLPRIGRYRYNQPIRGEDGWRVASLSEVGLDEKPIAQLVDQILNANPQDNPLPVQSLLIARHGKLAFEEYFYGYDPQRPHDTRSAGKTWATMLVGAAQYHGASIGPETHVYPLFPQYQPFAHWDPRKAKLTLGDLMTMTSGFACDDDDDNSPGNEDRMQSQQAQPDWYKYTLDLPMTADPGGDHATYCSAGLNLAGGVVQQVTGAWLPDLFQRDFAQPLEIVDYHLNLTPTGTAYMGGGLYMRPRDQLKLGQLYLSGGVWNRHRIVSEQWVNASTTYHSHLTPYFGIEHRYGYGWHIYQLNANGQTYTVYGAGGNGGQMILVIPRLDMVVGFTGSAYGEFQKWYKWQTELLPRYIISAVQK